MKHSSIKNWSIDERPREKLVLHGAQVLSDAELLAIIINHGTKDKSALEVAREVLAFAGNDFNILARKSFKELQKIDGIGPAKAISIMATLEISNRKHWRQHSQEIKSIKSSHDAASVLIPIMQDLNREIFYVLYLDQKNAIIHRQTISTGGVSATHVDIRLILKVGLEYLASGIIIAHNHPSGQLRPSASDKQLTQQIKEAGQVMNIKLLDHIIVAHNQYLSFADEGLL